MDKWPPAWGIGFDLGRGIENDRSRAHPLGSHDVLPRHHHSKGFIVDCQNAAVTAKDIRLILDGNFAGVFEKVLN